MGYINVVSLNWFIKEVSDGDFDVVIYVGGMGNYFVLFKYFILLL